MSLVELTDDADAQFHALPRGIRPRVLRLFERLESWPDVSGAKPLSGKLAGRWRMRTGDYRVQFHPERDEAADGGWRVTMEKLDTGMVFTMAMIDMASVQTLTLAGERFVVMPETEFVRLTGEPPLPPLPPLPPANERGHYPAVERTRAIIARDIIISRRALGWSQAELARRAGIRAETLNRIEQAKRSPSLATFDKVHRALEAGEAEAAKGKARSKNKAKKAT